LQPRIRIFIGRAVETGLAPFLGCSQADQSNPPDLPPSRKTFQQCQIKI
jgi:hypothetical protein